MAIKAMCVLCLWVWFDVVGVALRVQLCVTPIQWTTVSMKSVVMICYAQYGWYVSRFFRLQSNHEDVTIGGSCGVC